LCIGFPEEEEEEEQKRYYFMKGDFYAWAWTTCQGMEDYIREILTSTGALLPPGKQAFTQ
jgi:hypothetical protein